MNLTTTEVETIDKILEVLKREVATFNVELNWTINEELIEVSCSNGYTASLFADNGKYIMRNEYRDFTENDVIDGLCRIRFEMIRFINPKPFQ